MIPLVPVGKGGALVKAFRLRVAVIFAHPLSFGAGAAMAWFSQETTLSFRGITG